jgi:iron complex outermembrane receptor protein
MLKNWENRSSRARTVRQGWLASAALTIALALPLSEAGAQSAARESHESDSAEIIVTAQKREQSLQDVPASVSALTGESLDRRGVEDFEDYARGVPGVSFNSDVPNEGKITMRGIPNLGGSGSTVAVYVNEIPVTGDDNRTGLSDVATYDLARIEVLRGPQGTLYGQSAMGGAIRLITNRPDMKEFSAEARGLLSHTSGSDDWNYGAQGLVNVPIVQDTVGLRIAGFYRRNAGFIDRVPNQSLLANGTLTPEQRASVLRGAKDINQMETVSFRATGLIRLGENVEITPFFMLTNTDWANQPSLNPLLGNLQSDVPVDEPISNRDRVSGLSVDVDLGGVRLISATSYAWRNTLASYDQSADFGQIFPFVLKSNSEIFSQELRLQSDAGGRLNWIVGAFYRDFDEEGGADLTDPGGTALFVKEATRDQYEIAAFADATFDITKSLHFNAGVRLYRGRQQRLDFDRGFFVGGGSRTQVGDARYDGVNPKFSLAYDVNDDAMIYATAAKGYRAGGANIPVPKTPVCNNAIAQLGLSSAPEGFGPDSLWNYEVGARTSWADGRLVVNGSAYVIKWRDIQLTQDLPGCGFSFGTNVGAATSKGAEIEITARPVRNLDLGLAFGYADGELEDSLPGIPGSQKGARIPNVPKWTFGASAFYSFAISSAHSIELGSNYQFTSRYRSSLVPLNANNRRDPVNTWNASIGLSGQVWGATLFVDNVLNDRPVVGANSRSGVNLYTITRPRTAGIRVRGNF